MKREHAQGARCRRSPGTVLQIGAVLEFVILFLPVGEFDRHSELLEMLVQLLHVVAAGPGLERGAFDQLLQLAPAPQAYRDRVGLFAALWGSTDICGDGIRHG